MFIKNSLLGGSRKGIDIFGSGLKHGVRSCEWVEDLAALPSKIDEILTRNKGALIYEKQCLVFKRLVHLVAEDAREWPARLTKEATRFRYTAGGIELLRVLNSGMEIIQVCADKEFPGVLFTILGSFGQFREIIDDVKRYCQFIHRFLGLSIKFINNMEHKCNLLQAQLTEAYIQDKLELLKGLKAWKSRLCPMRNTRPLKNLPRNFVSNSLIPLLETGLIPTTSFIDSKKLVQTNLLGRGSFGSVFRARWCNFDVAVKVFGSESSTIDKEIDVFSKMMGADSSHIVQMLGHCHRKVTIGQGIAEKTCFERLLLLELMNADLGSLIEKNIITNLLQSVDIILQIGKAMKHLHTNGVIYRDLKPSNILIKPRGTNNEGCYLIKLADFGTSKTNFSTGRHTAERGTHIYMAPEMRVTNDEGEGNYTKKVDVFSFGIICCEILTGQRVNPQNNQNDEQERLLHKLLKKDILIRLKTLVCNCLEHQGDKRPTFEQVCDELWLIMEELLIIQPGKCNCNCNIHIVQHVMHQYRWPYASTLVNMIFFLPMLDTSGRVNSESLWITIKNHLHDFKGNPKLGETSRPLGLAVDEIQDQDGHQKMLGISEMNYSFIGRLLPDVLNLLRAHTDIGGIHINWPDDGDARLVNVLEQLRRALPPYFCICVSCHVSSLVSLRSVSFTLFDRLYVNFSDSEDFNLSLLYTGLPRADMSKIFIQHGYVTATDLGDIVGSSKHMEEIKQIPQTDLGGIALPYHFTS